MARQCAQKQLPIELRLRISVMMVGREARADVDGSTSCAVKSKEWLTRAPNDCLQDLNVSHETCGVD